ncbi:MAG TPA: retroviral-like aspartic protease family protein [bacterium]|jgi:predicted aspartyl protease
MKRSVSLVTLVVAALTLGGCASMKLSVKPETPPAPATQTVQAYTSFWDAVDNVDLPYAQRQEESAEHKDLAAAMQTALDGKTDEAVEAVRKVWMSTADSATRHRSRELLENLLFTRARWKDILDLYTRDTSTVDPQEDMRALVKVYAAAPQEQVDLPAAPDTTAIKLNGVGLPTVEVMVNGHPRRFIVDTGAAVSVLSSDFAKECGVRAAEESAQAGTSNTKTVAIQAAVVDSLRWGKLLVQHHPVAIIEASHLRFRLLGVITLLRIDGIVGWNLLRELNVKMDYRNKIAVVQPPQKKDGMPRNLFDLGEPMVMLQNEQGTRFNFLLDTGANSTCLGQSGLNKLPAQTYHKRRTMVGGAGGMESFKAAVVPHLTLYTNGYALQFKNLRTGPEAKTSGVKRDGILGSDVAAKGAITLDFQNGRFEYELPATH